MKLSVIFSALFAVIAGTSLQEETFTYVGTYASATKWTDTKFKAWTTTKQAASTASDEKSAGTVEINAIVLDLNTRLTKSKFTSMTALTTVALSKMTKKGTGNTATVTVSFTATIKCGMNDSTSTLKKIKAAIEKSTTLFTTTSFTATAKTTYKIQALFKSGSVWNAKYTNLADPLTIVFMATEMDTIAKAINAQLTTPHKDTKHLTAKDVHVNKLIQEVTATSGRKRRSTGTTNVQFTATLVAPTASTTTNLTKLVKAINTDTKTSGAVKGSAERMIASVTMTLFALGFYMF